MANASYFAQPEIRDVYERRTVYVGTSLGDTARGEGLFAKRDIPSGEIAAYYAGFQFHLTEKQPPMFGRNMSQEEV